MVPSWSNINYNNGIKERVLFSIIGILFISIFPFLYGVKTSYSAYYYNNPPLFIGLLCLLGIGFIRTGEYWVKAGYFLILTAIFDAYNYEIIHHVAAINFFLICTYTMIKDKRFGYLGKASLLLTLLAFENILIFELFQVILIIIFNILYVLKIKKL